MAEEIHDTFVARAAAGDRAALELLLERHLPGLLAYVRLNAGKHLLARESSADIVQSACREALEHLGGFEARGEPAFRKWLYTVALNKIRERGRRQNAGLRDVRREIVALGTGTGEGLASLLPSFTTPSRIAIAAEDMQRLERAFAALPEDHRHVITAAKILGQSHAEIAAELGRSEGAVRVLLHRALFRLGELMGADAS